MHHHSLSNPSLVETVQPQYLATALSDSRHADCDTLLQKMLEVVSGGEHSNLSLLLQYLATALSDSRHADCDTLL